MYSYVRVVSCYLSNDRYIGKNFIFVINVNSKRKNLTHKNFKTMKHPLLLSRRILGSFMVAVALSMMAVPVSADTHLWITTEGSGLEITSGGNMLYPPPPPPHHHYIHHVPQPEFKMPHDHHGCKKCLKAYKKMHKQAVKHHKKGPAKPSGHKH